MMNEDGLRPAASGSDPAPLNSPAAQPRSRAVARAAPFLIHHSAFIILHSITPTPPPPPAHDTPAAPPANDASGGGSSVPAAPGPAHCTPDGERSFAPWRPGRRPTLPTWSPTGPSSARTRQGSPA